MAGNLSFDANTRKAELFSALPGKAVKCFACANGCTIAEGKRGICRMRFNKGGELFAPWGYVSAFACEPVEKKPFFHLLPGAQAMSFGMPGCNFRCQFCQNWQLSQTGENCEIRPITPAEISAAALDCGAQIVVSTYNEPIITAEWAKSVFEDAGKKGLKRAFVSNGFATQKSVEYLHPVIDAWKIDLKCFDDKKYKQIIGGALQPVLDTIRFVHKIGIWTEIVTLIIPGFNDTDAELSKIAGFIASVSPDIPWHVTAFHPDYKMANAQATDGASLERGVNAGKAAGLKYVYAGNLPINHDDTHCPRCRELLVERESYTVRIVNLIGNGLCGKCGEKIKGIFRK